MKLHQYELQKYYNQSLSQSKSIFWVGIVCIVLGFFIIGVILYLLAFKNITNNQLEVSIVGGVGGILANFIGLVYLKMYSETLKVLIEFHKKLVYTHNLHFENCLIARVENQEKKKKFYHLLLTF